MGRSTLAATLVALAALVACGPDGPGGSAPQGRLRVAASFYPLAEVASRVGGELVDVTDLTTQGVEPHDLELTTRDIDRIEDADVVLFLGGGFQPAIERAVARAERAVDLLDSEFVAIEGADGLDPHIWLDPTIMAAMVDTIRRVLVEIAPSRAVIFDANAAAFTAELLALDADMGDALGRCARRTVVTSHTAFSYLARRYDLSQESIAGLSPEADPDPRRLAELADQVRLEGITTVFTETLVSPRVAEALAREAGVKTAVLNPIEGLDAAERAAGGNYESVMRSNLAALRLALGCS